MLKSILQFVIFIFLLAGVHYWVLLPTLNVSNAVPVIYQHLLLGGFSIIVYLITSFIAENFFSIVGFVVLGFLTLKMVLVGAFIHVYDAEVTSEPRLKYILLAIYFSYLIFLLYKIVPLINVDSSSLGGEKKSE